MRDSAFGRHTGADGTSSGTPDHAQIVTDYEVLRYRYEEVLKENENLKAEQHRRMESYLRREKEFEAQIGELKTDLERQGARKPPADERMKRVREEHERVLKAIDGMQVREEGALRDQEKDLLRAFRARLWDVQFELENERSKKDDGQPSHDVPETFVV